MKQVSEVFDLISNLEFHRDTETISIFKAFAFGRSGGIRSLYFLAKYKGKTENCVCAYVHGLDQKVLFICSAAALSLSAYTWV